MGWVFLLSEVPMYVNGLNPPLQAGRGARSVGGGGGGQGAPGRESFTTRRFDLPLLFVTSSYMAHCMGACFAKGSCLSLCPPLHPQTQLPLQAGRGAPPPPGAAPSGASERRRRRRRPGSCGALDIRTPPLQGYLAHENPPPQDPTVALCLGTCGDPMGVGVSYERGIPVYQWSDPPPHRPKKNARGVGGGRGSQGGVAR